MHISFITTGDIEHIATAKRAYGLCGPLMALGHSVSIVLQDTPANRARLDMEAQGARAAWFQEGSQIAENLAKRALLKELSPDVVYVCAYGARNLVAPLRPERATYVVEHSELPSAIRGLSPARRFFEFGLEHLSRTAFDGQICASRYLEEMMRDKLGASGAGRILYSPYAFSDQMVSVDEETPRPDGVSAGKTVLYMGTLSANYGILDIIAAIGRLRESIPGIKLLVLGHGRDAEKARQFIERDGLSDCIELKGYVPDAEVPGYLAAADVFVAPLYDTIQDIARCPSKLFMYLPFRRPIVTSQIGEARELFGPDYEFYFQPGNAEALAATLGKALRTEQTWQAPWVVEDHSWEARAHVLDRWLKTL